MRRMRILVLLSAVAVVLSSAGLAVAADVDVWTVDLATFEHKITPPENMPKQPEPINIVAARNGWFSGKVMVSGKEALDGLKASVTPLKAESGAVIAADRLQVRYGVGWSTVQMSGYNAPSGLDILLESSPVGVNQATVWVTVNTPADAAPGKYQGTLTVTPAESEAVKVPVNLEVVRWTIPDTQNWQSWIELVQSIDTPALEYNVPLWSDAHFKHIARAFDYIGDISSRVVSLPIICHTNYGNAESLIRWIPQKDGSWKHDFSRFERYLDTAIEHMGEPKIVVINAWDIYLNPPEGEIVPESELPDRIRNHGYFLAVERMKNARRALRGKGPAVTVEIDGKTGEIDTLYLPPYEDEQSLAIWKPVWEGIRSRLKARGLLDKTMLGMLTDSWPTKEQVEFLHELSGGMQWVSNAHWSAFKNKGGKVHGIATVGYETNVWNPVVTLNPKVERNYGWQNPQFVATHYRLGTPSRMTSAAYRTQLELETTGNQRGVGRIGADTWWVLKNPKGARTGTVTSRYLQSQWRNLDITASILAPGPNGAVATTRYEYLREGAQDNEARIFIEQALLDEKSRAKIGEDLAKRAQELLDVRQRAIWMARNVDEEQIETLGAVTRPNRILKIKGSRNNDWCIGTGYKWFAESGWQDRSRELFEIAAEVAEKLAR